MFQNIVEEMRQLWAYLKEKGPDYKSGNKHKLEVLKI